MKGTLIKAFILIPLLILFSTIFTVSLVHAYPGPDPVEVSWYVTDGSGTPLDGASITIYWSTSTSGPFTIMPADDGAGTYVKDKIPEPDINQNPIYTGYWNPTYPNGMAVCGIHTPGGVSGLYFYVEIDSGEFSWYWPDATSYKPGDPSWSPVAASGSPTGYAAAGEGIGTGPTTAYPTQPLPENVIPEVPLGTIMTFLSMFIALVGFLGFKRFRPNF